MAGDGIDLELVHGLGSDRDPPGRRQRLELPETKPPTALDVPVGVELSQQSLRITERAAEPLSGALPDPERELREGELAEQVVPVAVSREQPAYREACLLEQRRERIEFVR